MRRVVPQIDAWVARAKEVASILAGFGAITVNPNPPHTNTFQIYVQADVGLLNERNELLSKRDSSFVFFPFRPTAIPGLAMNELHCFGNALGFELPRLEPFVAELLEGL
jgi:hypothetical protein